MGKYIFVNSCFFSFFQGFDEELFIDLKNQYVRIHISLWDICRNGFSFIRIILNNMRKLTFFFQIFSKIRENVPWPMKFKYILIYSQYPRKHFSGKCFKGALSDLWQFLAAESPLKKTKNALYFALQSLFVLKIFKLLFWPFGHVEKRLD